MLVFLCDSAASNLRALRYLAVQCRETGRRMFSVAETCYIHQLHIVKSALLEVAGAAGLLYSFSKVLRLNSSMCALERALEMLSARESRWWQGRDRRAMSS